MTEPTFPEGSKFQYVPVPNEHVPAVLHYLGRLMTPSIQSSPMATASAEAPDFNTTTWSDEDVLDFANKDIETARIYRRIMEALTEPAFIDKWVSIDDVSAATGLERSVVKAFRTHLYRHLHKYYTYKHAPFPAANGEELIPKRKPVVWYRVSAAHAAQWDRVRPYLK